MIMGESETFFRPATGALSGYVETFWAANGILEDTRELIAPTGSTVAALILGPPILQGKPGGEAVTMTRGFLIGPHERPIINQPTGRTFAVGLVTAPFGCESVLESHLTGELNTAVQGLDRCAAAVALLTHLSPGERTHPHLARRAGHCALPLCAHTAGGPVDDQTGPHG